TVVPLVLQRGADIPRQGSGMGAAFDQRQVLYRPELPDGHRFFEDEHYKAEGLRSVVYVPLITKTRVLGTFQIASRAPHQYSDTDIGFLLHVAQSLALALDNTLAYEEISGLKDQLSKENVYLQEEIKSQFNHEEIIGGEGSLKAVLKEVDKVAGTDATVLISGETGTGKELFARAIHQQSHRRQRLLIKVNCAALSPGLVESELFGHEKGSFTGALQRKIGRFELAHQGTIFLDEIGDIPAETQVKLLRVLQEQEFERVGGTETIKVDVRVIGATNRDLISAMDQQKFREDLFYRLNVFPLHIPPLRERKSDIPILAQYFVDKYAGLFGKRFEGIHPATMERLIQYPWPGNVREFENIIERAVILANGPILALEESWPSLRLTKTRLSEEFVTLEEMERDYLLKVLQKTKWVIGGNKGAAEILNVHPNTLRSRLEKLGIKKPE
ncbi:MAG: sigma 54-interacting transcriptional regulator, partial [Nitrospirota bacterium]